MSIAIALNLFPWYSVSPDRVCVGIIFNSHSGSSEVENPNLLFLLCCVCADASLCTGYRGACTLARNGGAISMRYPCCNCGQLRCRSHCQCVRDGTLSGASRGRPARGAVARAKAKAKAQPKAAAAPPQAQPAPPVLAAAPVGRAPGLHAEVMDAAAWWTCLLQTVRHASRVVVASYVYDHPRLTQTLLHRLGDNSCFELVMLVDKEMFEQRSAYYERPRLDRLRRAGAVIELCRGSGRLGSFHKKVIVADRRTAFLGSANFTLKSEDNDELLLLLRGPPVQDILRDLDQRRGVAWRA